jgi:hypothetical protein
MLLLLIMMMLLLFKSFSAVASGFVNDFDFDFFGLFFSGFGFVARSVFYVVVPILSSARLLLFGIVFFAFLGSDFFFFFFSFGIQSKIRGIYLVLHSLCACFVLFTRGRFLLFSGFVVCERASLVLCYSSSIRGFCVDSVVLYYFLPSYCSPGRGGLGENTHLLELHHLDSVYTVLHLLLAKRTFCECSLAWYLVSGHHCTFSSCYWKPT